MIRTTKRARFRGRFPGAVALLGLCVLSLAVSPARARTDRAEGFAADGPQLGRPGYVIIASGLDSTLGYQWRLGPGPGQRSLTWPQGMLSLPDSVAVESLRGVDLAIACGASLAGLGSRGNLLFQDGIYPVSEPIVLSDGVLHLYLADGELEILGQRIRYAAPTEGKADPRSGYLFLAGIVLLVVVLLRRIAVRKRHRQQS